MFRDASVFLSPHTGGDLGEPGINLSDPECRACFPPPLTPWLPSWVSKALGCGHSGQHGVRARSTFTWLLSLSLPICKVGVVHPKMDVSGAGHRATLDHCITCLPVDCLLSFHPRKRGGSTDDGIRESGPRPSGKSQMTPFSCFPHCKAQTGGLWPHGP